MRRMIFVPTLAALFVAAYLMQSSLPAQAPVEDPPVVSDSYIPLPPPPQETVVEAPSPQSVWVGGHWDRTPDKWNWIAGTWVKPPYQNAYYLPGYWQHQDGKFVWEDAHWAAAPQGVIVQKPIPLPPVYEEPIPVAPVATAPMVWQPGHWEWRGTWIWIPGTYVPSTIPNATFIPGQWVRGLAGFWRWSPGHWAS